MATLIYSPGISVRVKTANGILDLSEDIVSFQVNLRENAVHTFNFKLQNAQRKYDGRLLPMDKITVQLKRINWLQTFTGYLNDGPVFQAWPGTLDITSNCTLKRPQFWYWDPTSAEATTMITNALQVKDDGAIPIDSQQGDGGISSLIKQSLTQVVNWPLDQIHIGEIPPDWFKFAAQVGNLIEQDTAMYQQLGGSFIAAGSGTLKVNLPASSYGNNYWGAPQVHNASVIYNTIHYTMNLPDADNRLTIMSLMAAMQESSLLNRWSSAAAGSQSIVPNDGEQKPNYDSSGLFQQRLIYYGPISKIMNPVTSTQAFVTKLQGVGSGLRGHGQGPVDFASQIQQVQGSADGSAYAQWQADAVAMVDAMNKLASIGSSPTPAVGAFNGADIGSTNEKSTGSMIAKVANDLIVAHQSSPIIYVLGGDDPDTTEIGNVKKLDCSSLIDWVYYHSTGRHLWQAGAGRSNVASIFAGGTQIPLSLAPYIQGAALCKNPNEHCGISLGNGKDHVAAHMPYSDPHQDVNVSPIDGNGFNAAVLLPGIDYTGSATTQAAANQLRTILNKPTTLAPQLSGIADPNIAGGTDTGTQNDAFATLINLTTFQQDMSGIGTSLGGAVTLINDQPFLPWLQNVVNSSMRSFCSAPNGDFISWFPDYFGVWNTAGVMNVQLIELQDFTVTWSDQQMVTHQFVLGNLGSGILDAASGTIGVGESVASDLRSLAQQTSGLATMDFPEIFKAIYGQSASSAYTTAFLRRFGARPDVQQMPYISKGRPEFFMALYLFMQRWAGQFTASVPLTFMPELFPGMLLRIPEFGFQAYVTGVTHQGSFGQSGGFTTTVQISAPSNIGSTSRDDLLALLPMGGRPLV